jgi:UDP-N-acetylglucosamine--N-acetylmuramyl-(pentapeptide) pyrophosphoryl-undecaprenol N-acetylglucosamine transferase
MRVLLACDRSGGHIFPALALAEVLKQKDACFGRSRSPESIYFFAPGSSLKQYIREAGFKVIGRRLPRNIILEGVFRFWEALSILITLRPAKVIGFGGRDSFFLVFLSSAIGLDTSIYEPNAGFGKANRILSFFTRRILRGFEQEKVDKKTRVIGVPLRPGIKKIDTALARRALGFDQTTVILCLGGSQGASFINSIFTRFIQSCQARLQIIHLTGKKEYFEILQFYNKINNKAFVKDFYYQMELLYSAADLVVARAGASTLAELTFYGLPSVLIPHPQAGRHQKENALYFMDRQAAFVCLQEDFSFEQFKQRLDSLINDEGLRRVMKVRTSGIPLGVVFEDFCARSHI